VATTLIATTLTKPLDITATAIETSVGTFTIALKTTAISGDQAIKVNNLMDMLAK